jgi:hypothetical protein
MPERQPEDWGIPLWEAIERWTPEEIWRRYRGIAKEDSSYFIDFCNPVQEEARRLRAHIERILTAKLRQGELIASGIAMSPNSEIRRQDIPSGLWSHLQLDILGSKAFGHAMQLVDLRFWTGRETRSEQAAVGDEEVAPAPSRPPGRPSIMRMLEDEMRWRAARDEMEPTLRREAQVLAMWAHRQPVDEHVPKPKSIEKKLGRIYKELKRTNSPDK